MYLEKVRTVHLNVWFCSFWPFLLFLMSLTGFFFFLTNPKHHLNPLTHYTLQKLQFGHKRRVLVFFVLKIWAKHGINCIKYAKKTTTFIVTSNHLFFVSTRWMIFQWLGPVLQSHWGMRIIEKHSLLSILPEDKKGGWITKFWLWISSKFLTDKGVIKQWDSPYVNGLSRLKWLNESSKIYHRNITLNVRDKGLIGAYSKRANI